MVARALALEQFVRASPCPRHKAGGRAAFPCWRCRRASGRRARRRRAGGRSAARRSAGRARSCRRCRAAAMPSNMAWLSATAVDSAMTSRLNSDSSMPSCALRHPVAHGRRAARDLRGGADFAGVDLHPFGIAAIGLVGRKHVVIGGDDADVRAAAGCDRRPCPPPPPAKAWARLEQRQLSCGPAGRSPRGRSGRDRRSRLIARLLDDPLR